MTLLVAATPASAQSDADFTAAKAAFERGDWRALDALAPAVAGHPLDRYVQYWQLKSRLDEAPADAVDAFIARYPDTPLADRLRVEWLKALGKRGDWNRFAASYPPPGAEDTELTCYAIQYRYQRDGAAALAAAKPLWLTGQSTPDACNPLFAALVARGDLSLADRKARFQLAVANGNTRLAQAIADDLPPPERITGREFAAIDRDPMRAVRNGRFDWKSPSGRALALYALERAARKDAADARVGWLKWRARLPGDDRGYGNLRIAWHAARQLDPAANQWFKEVTGITLTPEQQAWRVRAALRASAWSDVQSAIEALPTAMQQEPVWRYWRARALAARNANDEEARALFATLAGGLDYYGLLAAEALGRGPAQLAALARDAATIDPVALASFGARPDVQRAVLLSHFDLRIESMREWSYAIRGLDDDALLLAAEYARKSGLYDRAIYTAERVASRVDFAMRYMTPYRAQFEAAARDQGIDCELLYGIARQESRFVADIVSGAGAIGLMQLMPGTARWVAKQLAMTDYSPTRIADVQLNTQFGAFYFRYWQDRLGRLPELAAAAYNAGPSRAQSWRPQAAPLEGAIWVETIPFNETRDYVKRVLANTMLYTRALDRPYVPLTQRLGTVTPRDFDNVAVVNP
ncbi:MAG TPA: transglycosylase SLT domain-containing protein [Casimicrobiaceae bacterium]